MQGSAFLSEISDMAMSSSSVGFSAAKQQIKINNETWKNMGQLPKKNISCFTHENTKIVYSIFLSLDLYLVTKSKLFIKTRQLKDFFFQFTIYEIISVQTSDCFS